MPESKTTRMFPRVRQAAAPRAKLLCTTAGLLESAMTTADSI